MNSQQLASIIDHTILKPETSPEDVDRLVGEAIEHRFASVCVNGVFVERVRRSLDEGAAAGEHGVLACAVAGFPLGAVTPMMRAMEATQCAKAGAQEIDIVAWLPRILSKQTNELRDDLLQTTRAVRAVNPAIVVKVIIESAALRSIAADQSDFEAMIECACEAARASGCDFVKTSTGFHPAGGADVESVRIMKKHAGALKVKASGGVRTRDDALKMVEAGADRIGCSSSVAIVTQS